MRYLILVVWFLVEATIPAGAESRVVRSRSGQFQAYDVGGMQVPPLLLEEEKQEGIIVLTPDLVVVSTERIKEGILQQLGAYDRWRGKIRFLFDSRSGPDRFSVVSHRYTNGWSYEVTIGRKIRRRVWQRGCVAVILLEMSNRLAGQRSTEVPYWLIDGMAMELDRSAVINPSPDYSRGHLIDSGGEGFSRVIPSHRHQDALIATRAWLAENVPVDAGELFLPSERSLNGEGAEEFVYSAHFFYQRLLTLPAGKESLIQFLSSLSHHLNWQQAFFASFRLHFKRMLDVEKWWSVSLSDLTHQTTIHSWSLEQSLASLERTLLLPALVGNRRNELARKSFFSLQQVVARWERPDQETVLQMLLNRLRIVGIYAHADVAVLVREYQDCLEDYLELRRQELLGVKRRLAIRQLPAVTIRDTNDRLDRLDLLRRQLADSVLSSGVTVQTSALRQE